MVLDVRTIPPGNSEVSRTTGLDDFKADLPPLSGKISCEAAIDRTGDILRVDLRFNGVLSLECSRCLGNFTYPFSCALRLVVKEQSGKFGPSQDDETVDFYFDSRHPDVDLGPAMYEEILTTVPIKPLCSEECKGIEFKSPGSAGEEIDPRWEALKKFKQG
jgi:uncharacterized protein